MKPRDTLLLKHIIAAADDIEAVWSMIVGDLPSLRTNVQRLLEDARQDVGHHEPRAD
jgi:hypothetical protein